MTVQTCNPLGRGKFLTKGYHMNKLGRGEPGNTTCKISKLHAFQFQRGKILKFAVFVSIFQLVTPGTWSVLTPGASYEQTW